MKPIARLLLAIIVVGISTKAYSEELRVDELQERIFTAIGAAAPAVVSITGGGIEFSGVIVTPEGHVLTAGHAVQAGRRYRLRLPDGQRLTGYGVGVSLELDIAMIKINNASGLPHVAMGDSSKLVSNQPCLGLSFPGGQEAGSQPLVRFGYIVTRRAYQRMLQTTAVIQPGDSGGALFDLNGNLIGIHSSIGKSTQRNYEVPINTIKKFWNQLHETEQFSTVSGTRLPKLGFRCEENRRESGLRVISLDQGGVADVAGLRLNDLIVEVENDSVSNIAEMRRGMKASIELGVRDLEIAVRRGSAKMVLNVPFKLKERPKIELPKIAARPGPAPQAIPVLKSLPKQFQNLESVLDDNCVTIYSKIGDRQTKIMGTKFKNTCLLVSKNSMVGDDPFVRQDGSQVLLRVVKRDSSLDLVLLKSRDEFSAGLDLNNLGPLPTPKLGRFLISPDPLSTGLVSIRGSFEFNSRKYESRGYLGVTLSTFGNNEGVRLDRVHTGAADRAGMETGDVIVSIDGKEIRNRNSILRFLREVDPNREIAVDIIRENNKLTKPLTLGAPPSLSNHPADAMLKSGRRDGFPIVFSHDANLHPSNCGGPVFDLEGHLIGLNIARNSRVRSYLMPRRFVQEFVENNQ